jgi:hypothetical protein
VLKQLGDIWKYYTRPVGNRVDVIEDVFDQIDDGTGTDDISSAGALLYVLKRNGNIWKYSPVIKGAPGTEWTHRETESTGPSPYEEIYREGDARAIKADGGVLYFIKSDGTVWRFKDEKLDQVFSKSRARKIDALNGILYILTAENAIWRYNSPNDELREIREAGAEDNEDIAAYGPDIFVIKNNGNVWRYNEVILTR